jgi:hypothetical protein
MKKLLVIFSFAVLTGCQPTQTKVSTTVEAQTEKTAEVVQAEKTPEISLEDLTKEQKAALDKSLTPKVREFLDNAQELEILVHLDRETEKQRVIGMGVSPNKVAKITDASLKKSILDSFYFDTAKGSGQAACWSPRHLLRANNKGTTIEILICFECNWYRGTSQFGKIYGTLQGTKSRSLILLNEAIEKYGVDVQ